MTTDRGQVDTRAAELYETLFVPRLFRPYATQLVAAAEVGHDDDVLDVACGTGVVARHAAAHAGSVTAIDCNPGMLAVARRVCDGVAFHQGFAERLPFDDDAFDRVLCQFALMFFEDPVAALAELGRVARPGGRVAVSTWADLDDLPVYAAFVALLRERFGDAPADALAAPFTLGDRDRLLGMCDRAALPGARVVDHHASEDFDSVHGWVDAQVRAWTLSTMIDDDGLHALHHLAAERLAPWTRPDGTFSFPNTARVLLIPV